ncbi:acyl-CoA synthetase [Phaeobacter gallaeciensis]|uniref:Acyl-CoA synthetase n=1 Tax=Phaeobacter gallaeciensis TaxID=60890 RepID=A0A366WW20_9RHOB|nr:MULTISPECIES: AMP-binding protein [Roseobacteraceae]MBT8168641.1 AMP-binding protein [Falsiruegeria litorea]RBW54094.1 acyl-CoA synthetase [Phaeobacter gallaeciensis]
MADFKGGTIRTRDDLERFEAEMTLDQRLPERSILDVFAASAAQHPTSTAITMLMTGAEDEHPRRVNYGQLLGLIQSAANVFSSLGGPAPGVAYMLPTLIETYVALWGAETAGYAVPINFLLQPDSIAELIKASGAKILVALGPHPQLDIWEKALELREQIPDLILVRVSPPGTPAEDGVVDFGTALAEQPDDRLIFGEPRGGDDVAAYFHTGGTTGVPKLVTHTHRSQLVSAFGGAVMCEYSNDDKMTATLPLFHVAGTIVAGLSAFMAGVELVVMSPGGLRNPTIVEGFWRLVAQHKVTIVGGVPTALGAVLQVPVGDNDISAVRTGLTGAALLPPAVGARFKDVTGCQLHEILGMTESSGLVSIDPLSGPGSVGSVGWALPYTRVEILRLKEDGSLGEPCATDEIGVITIMGDHVSSGYKDPKHNEGVFNAGRLNSGDLGFKDTEGRIYIAGRSKDLIIRSGHNIDPAMIENAMASHPAVALAAAVGMPDAYAGELPVCFVELLPGADVSIEDLHQHAQSLIDERPAWPKNIYAIDAIPLTTVGKIFKPSLRCDAAKRKITDLVRNDMGLANSHVEVVVGGARGMRVTVTLSEDHRSSVVELETALAAFLFEARVHVG